jgi:hypothetical protein
MESPGWANCRCDRSAISRQPSSPSLAGLAAASPILLSSSEPPHGRLGHFAEQQVPGRERYGVDVMHRTGLLSQKRAYAVGRLPLKRSASAGDRDLAPSTGRASGRPVTSGTSARPSLDAVMASRSDPSFPGVTRPAPGTDGNREISPHFGTAGVICCHGPSAAGHYLPGLHVEPE